MRLYRVVFAHRDYGSNYEARTVAVGGYVAEAIAKASQRVGTDAKQLTVEEVILVGQESVESNE